MIRVVSLNLNGIRSATRKGWLQWMAKQNVDIVCVQEVKAQERDLDDSMKVLASAGKPLVGHFHFAQKKGYSGVGLYSRKKPKTVRIGFGDAEFDDEGRYVEADFGQYTVISLYLPSGSSSEERLAAKFRFLKVFKPHLRELIASGRELILCGDLNIAHKEIDLKNWKSNQKNSGFLPEERAWLSSVIEEDGLVDVFRTLDDRAEQYTWWSSRGQAWANNVGWRLDYHLASPGLASKAKRCEIYLKQRFSDHAPVLINYSIR